MTAEIIKGKEIAANITAELLTKVMDSGKKPGLAIVLIGNNPASEIYVNLKHKKSCEIGFHCEIHRLKSSITQQEALKLIDDLNQRKDIHGIIVQSPLPKHLDEKFIMNSVLPHKDVDGFTTVNLGYLMNDENILVPATAKASIELIKTTGIEIKGKNAVVVGRSTIVGKPVAHLLLQENATVTICHSKTKNLKEHTSKADILIAAVGVPKLIKKDMVKPGAVVIDVGINRVPEGIVGDVDYEEVKEVAGFITPVPKGVGPMTIAMLLQNTFDAMKFEKS